MRNFKVKTCIEKEIKAEDEDEALNEFFRVLEKNNSIENATVKKVN